MKATRRAAQQTPRPLRSEAHTLPAVYGSPFELHHPGNNNLPCSRFAFIFLAQVDGQEGVAPSFRDKLAGGHHSGEDGSVEEELDSGER